jgi:pSer/pThr/pTyr-binding forkhead associated (FHA) protein
MKTLYTIGRESNSDIILWNEESSRCHAQIRIDQKGKLWLMDMSTNGTYLNGMRISPNYEVEVSRKDEILFAGVEALDWSRIPKQKNKLLWIILPISIVVLIAIAVVLCCVLIPKGNTESEGEVTPIATEVPEQPETVNSPEVSNPPTEVDVPSQADSEQKVPDEKKKKESESSKIAKEIYKNLNRKKNQSSSKENNNNKSESVSESEAAPNAVPPTTEETPIDAIF